MTPATTNPTHEEADHHRWAAQEIAAAQRHHPDHADALQRCGELLAPTCPEMQSQLVYAAHCRELVARVVNGDDTRSATAIEVCVRIARDSPTLVGENAGLYARMWAHAFRDSASSTAPDYELTFGAAIDELERRARRRYAQPSRYLTTPAGHPYREANQQRPDAAASARAA